MTNKTVHLVSITVFVLTWNAAHSFADPYLSTECTTSGQIASNWTSSDKVVYYYIEDNFGEELDWCLVNSSDNGLSNENAINAVHSAAEIWNRESRGAVFQYAGTLSLESIEDSCSSFTKEPAVFIRMVNGCSDSDCDTNDGVLGRVSDVGEECSDVLQLSIYGDRNTDGSCDGSDGGLIEWTVDGEGPYGTNQPDLVSVLVHELGHVLGLGHSDSTTDDAVMDTGMSQDPTDRHLYPWDMDCVDDVGSGSDRKTTRSLEYYWKGLDSSATWNSSVGSSGSSEYVTKSTKMGGQVRDDMSRYTALYSPDDELWYDLTGTTGSMSLTVGSSFGGSELDDLFIAPLLFTAFERSGSDQDHRINYALVESNTDDPPDSKVKRSNDWFVTSATHRYREWNGSSYDDLSSHIPVVTAWDDVSKNTVFVSVDTGRSLANLGEIKVHPGLNGTSVNYSLRQGSVLSDNQTPPSDSYTTNPDFDWVLKTDATPGVACADTTSTFTYNCLLAWADKGIPDARVLYTYFRVVETSPSSGDYEVEWLNDTNPVRVRSGSDTVGDVSVAYFEGAFWMTWKNTESAVDVEWTTTSAGYWNWSSVTEEGRANVAESRAYPTKGVMM